MSNLEKAKEDFEKTTYLNPDLTDDERKILTKP